MRAFSFMVHNIESFNRLDYCGKQIFFKGIPDDSTIDHNIITYNNITTAE